MCFFNHYKLVAQSKSCITHEPLGIAKLGNTRAHTLAIRGCAHHLAACLKILLVPKVLLWTTNRAVKMHKGLDIKQCNIAICIPRITRSHMLPCSHYTWICHNTVTLHCTHIHTEGMVGNAADSRRGYDLRTDLGGSKCQTFLGEHAPKPPYCLLHLT